MPDLMDTQEIRKKLEHPLSPGSFVRKKGPSEDMQAAVKAAVAVFVVITAVASSWLFFELGRNYQRKQDHKRYLEHLESLQHE